MGFLHRFRLGDVAIAIAIAVCPGKLIRNRLTWPVVAAGYQVFRGRSGKQPAIGQQGIEFVVGRTVGNAGKDVGEVLGRLDAVGYASASVVGGGGTI